MGKSKTLEFDINNLRFYYGIPHSHTVISTGRGTPIEAFDYARHNGLDFLIITDHNNYLTKTINIKNTSIQSWDALKAISSKYNKKHESFLSIIGFESKTNPYGDINIVNPNLFFTGTVNNFQLLILWMLNNPSAFISINHPHKIIESLDYNPIFNKLITSIEVGNGSYPNRYSRYDKYYYSLLDKGWKLGAINGQDNHRINFGDTENLTCYIGNALSIDSLIQAFRARRTYSTESRTLLMYFTINNSFMGDIVSKNDNILNFTICAKDLQYKIQEIQIVTNTGSIIKKITDLNLNKIKYLYKHEPQKNETWYLIKIFSEGAKVCISSPIFRE